MKKDIRYQKEVLIETYWNVKTGIFHLTSPGALY